MYKKIFLVVTLCLLFCSAAYPADFTQVEIELAAHQELAQSGIFTGTAQSVATYLYGHVYVYTSVVSANDPTFGTELELQVCSSSGGTQWITWWSSTTNTVAPATEAIAANTSSNIYSIASETGFSVGAWQYAESTSTVVSGRWEVVVDIDTSAPKHITVTDAVDWTKTTSDVLWAAPDVYLPIYVDFGGVKRVRFNVYNYTMTLGNPMHFKTILIAVTDME